MAPLQPPFVPFQLVSSAVQCKAEESESPAFNLVETWLAATPLTNHPPCCQEGERGEEKKNIQLLKRGKQKTLTSLIKTLILAKKFRGENDEFKNIIQNWIFSWI